MDLSGVDLNLLVVLDALLAERHVTRAAARLSLSQPAMSRALGRLRELLGDEILVRAKGQLVLTPRAEGLVEPVRRVLEEVSAVIAPPSAFEAARSTRTFTILTNEYAGLVIGTRLVAEIRRAAPEVRISFRSVHAASSAERLEDGRADLALMPRVEARAGFYRKAILEDEHACLARTEHAKHFDLQKFVALEHAVFSPVGKATTSIDERLSTLGLERKVATWVHQFASIPFFVSTGDLVATVQARAATMLQHAPGAMGLPPIAAVPLPPELALPPYVLYATWHERARADAGVRWLIERVCESAEAHYGETVNEIDLGEDHRDDRRFERHRRGIRKAARCARSESRARRPS